MVSKSSTYGGFVTVIGVCIAVILLCAVVAPWLSKHPSWIERFAEGEAAQAVKDANTNEAITNAAPAIENKPQSQLPDEPRASLPEDPSVFNSRRNSLIREMIMNLYFLSIHPTMPTAVKNDVVSLYQQSQDRFKMLMSSFDVLCQNIKVNSKQAKVKLADACNKFYIDLFAHREKALYPTFDAMHTEVLDNAMQHEATLFSINKHTYQIIKNFYTPRYIKYDFDTTNNLVRAKFYTNQGVTKPTYFVLSAPFALEYEQYGIFNIVYDINPKYNIMNYYHSDADNTERAMYITPTPGKDEQGNLLNYMEGNYALNQIATTLNVSSQYEQFKFFYTDFYKAGVNTTEYNALVIELTKDSKGSLALNYIGNQTSYVNATTVIFENRHLGITVDATNYASFLDPLNQVLQADTTKDFNIYVVLAFNTVSVYFMYKKQSYEHHLMYRRTNLLSADGEAPYMKIFMFEPNIKSPSGYVHGHNSTFTIITHIPNMLRMSQDKGYSFR